MQIISHHYRYFTFVLGLLSLIGLPEYVSAKSGTCCWEATKSGNKNKVYLFGSFHFGKKEYFPLPDVVENAFAKSDKLAVELDITKIKQSTQIQNIVYAVYCILFGWVILRLYQKIDHIMYKEGSSKKKGKHNDKNIVDRARTKKKKKNQEDMLEEPLHIEGGHKIENSENSLEKKSAETPKISKKSKKSLKQRNLIGLLQRLDWKHVMEGIYHGIKPLLVLLGLCITFIFYRISIFDKKNLKCIKESLKKSKLPWHTRFYYSYIVCSILPNEESIKNF